MLRKYYGGDKLMKRGVEGEDSVQGREKRKNMSHDEMTEEKQWKMFSRS